MHKKFEQPEAKGIVKTIRLPIPKRLSVWHRPASVSNRRCCRDVSRLGQWLSVLNGEHDQEIRLDRFLRRFHYRQHAAAAFGRWCHFNFWICFFNRRWNRRNLGTLSIGPVSL